jgi:hypothetical protein
MHLRKAEAIIVAFACSLAGVHAVLAKPPHGACGALRGHRAQACYCGSKYDDSRRYRARLLAGFETEYDVEKWEKAYRQGHPHWGSRSKQRRCGVDF